MLLLGVGLATAYFKRDKVAEIIEIVKDVFQFQAAKNSLQAHPFTGRLIMAKEVVEIAREVNKLRH